MDLYIRSITSNMQEISSESFSKRQINQAKISLKICLRAEKERKRMSKENSGSEESV